MRTRIWHSDWKPRWLIRCVSAALLSFMDKQEMQWVAPPAGSAADRVLDNLGRMKKQDWERACRWCPGWDVAGARRLAEEAARGGDPRLSWYVPVLEAQDRLSAKIKFPRVGRGGVGCGPAGSAALRHGLAGISAQGAREAHVGVDRARTQSVGRAQGRRRDADGEALRAARSVAVAAEETRIMNRLILVVLSGRLVPYWPRMLSETAQPLIGDAD